MKKFQGYVNNSRIQLTISLLAIFGRCSLVNKLAYKIINIVSELNSIQESIYIWLKWKTRFFHCWQKIFLEILTSFTIVKYFIFQTEVLKFLFIIWMLFVDKIYFCVRKKAVLYQKKDNEVVYASKDVLVLGWKAYAVSWYEELVWFVRFATL